MWLDRYRVPTLQTGVSWLLFPPADRLPYIIEVPEGLHRREHFERRSDGRDESEHDILVGWTDEAYSG